MKNAALTPEMKSLIKAKGQALVNEKHRPAATKGKSLSELTEAQIKECINGATFIVRKSLATKQRAAQVDLAADLVGDALLKLYENPTIWDSSKSALHTFIARIAKQELTKQIGRRFKREGVSYSYGINDSEGNEQDVNISNGERLITDEIATNETVKAYTDLLTPRERVYVKLAMGAISLEERNEKRKNGILCPTEYITGEIWEIMGFKNSNTFRQFKSDFEAKNAKRFKK